MMSKFKLFLCLPILLGSLFSQQVLAVELLTNGSFESGDFTGWGTATTVSPFCTGPAVVGAGASCWSSIFSTAPTDGSFVAHHGFDGSGPGTIDIFQDVAATAASSLILTFDWRAGWDFRLGTFAGAARLLDVVIQPFGGGAVSSITNFLTTGTGNTFNFDTGSQSATLDLSSLAGTAFRINFRSTIPNNFSGPAHLQLDNVSLTAVPAPATIGLLLLGLMGFGAVRRKNLA